MALVYNASSQEHQVRVHGSWFTFKPKMMKEMSDEKVDFLTSVNAYLGFVSLPEKMSDIDFRASAEGKAILKEAEENGISNRVRYLEELKKNELVSLQRDLDMKNLKYDARLEIQPEMVKHFEELAGYKTRKQDEAQKRLEKIKELEATLAKE